MNIVLVILIVLTCHNVMSIPDESVVYDAVIIGGGIAGLTTGYMLRDKNILLLEKEDRVGGRVLTETVSGSLNNIGTQGLVEEDTSFLDLLNELGVKRIPIRDVDKVLLHLDGVFYENYQDVLSVRVLWDALKMYSRASREYDVFRYLPHDDPKWMELVAKDSLDLLEGYSREFRGLIKGYISTYGRPKYTSAGIGAGLMLDPFIISDAVVCEKGFQTITDTLADKIAGKVILGSEVVDVKEVDGIVLTKCVIDGVEMTVRSKDVVMAVQAPTAVKMLPEIPEWKKNALEGVEYSGLFVVSVFLERNVPWERFSGMISDSSIFPILFDMSYGVPNQDGPIVYNFFISFFPGETEKIQSLMGMTDDEVVALVFKDLKKATQKFDTIEDYVISSKVTRFPTAEVEPSPKFYVESLPHLASPVGHIHFCGDYTDSKIFVDGAVFSAFRVARELGSNFVVSEDDEKRHPPKPPRWGSSGLGAMISSIAFIIYNFCVRPRCGKVTRMFMVLTFVSTFVYPSYFPSSPLVYYIILLLNVIVGSAMSFFCSPLCRKERSNIEKKSS